MNKPSATRNQLRIIGGQWRSRKLSFPNAEGLRPTGDRIRETLFNWLAPDIRGAQCLDLFSGSGALGFEALSRGAAHCVMLEKDARAQQHLLANAALLKTNDAQIIHTNALDFLQQNRAAQQFDLVFIDPPFEAQLWASVFEALEAKGWLSDNARVYVESPRDQKLPVPPHWNLHRDKQAGQVTYQLYYRTPV